MRWTFFIPPFIYFVSVFGFVCVCVLFFLVLSLVDSKLPLLGLGLGGFPVVLINVDRLPRIADPLVAHRPGSKVAAVDDVVGQGALLLLVLVLRCRWVSARLGWME